MTKVLDETHFCVIILGGLRLSFTLVFVLLAIHFDVRREVAEGKNPVQLCVVPNVLGLPR